MKCNKLVAKYTFENSKQLSRLQWAVCQIIPQGISISLSIRELIRQAYLFSALILIRPLIERAAIISYLNIHPEKVDLWEKGWIHGSRPSLAEMLKEMSGGREKQEAQMVCDAHNHIIHGDPYSSFSNLINLEEGDIGYSSGKMIDNKKLCDEIAMESQCYLIIITKGMESIFPNIKLPKM